MTKLKTADAQEIVALPELTQIIKTEPVVQRKARIAEGCYTCSSQATIEVYFAFEGVLVVRRFCLQCAPVTSQ
jgi:hypothetical protein